MGIEDAADSAGTVDVVVDAATVVDGRGATVETWSSVRRSPLEQETTLDAVKAPTTVTSTARTARTAAECTEDGGSFDPATDVLARGAYQRHLLQLSLSSSGTAQ